MGSNLKILSKQKQLISHIILKIEVWIAWYCSVQKVMLLLSTYWKTEAAHSVTLKHKGIESQYRTLSVMFRGLQWKFSRPFVFILWQIFHTNINRLLKRRRIRLLPRCGSSILLRIENTLKLYSSKFLPSWNENYNGVTKCSGFLIHFFCSGPEDFTHSSHPAVAPLVVILSLSLTYFTIPIIHTTTIFYNNA